MLRLTVVTLSLFLAGLSTLALVPAASARAYCSEAIDGGACPGLVCERRWNGFMGGHYWHCYDQEPIIVCIREPCPGPPQ